MDKAEEKQGFGTFMGVFVPNVTMMFGVILFLRLGLVVSYVGLPAFISIIALSMLVMIITAFSIIPIVTNMNVGSGGIYYIISRSLGIEAGAGVGLALYSAQAISLVLCVTGFSYSVQNLFPFMTITTIEMITLITLALLSFISASLVLRTQIFIFIILLISIASLLLPSVNVSDTSSLTPFYANGLSYWAAFAIFYPAMTGIEAGMALSGCLKNPSKSLSWGNLSSLLFTGLVYVSLGTFLYYRYPQELLQSSPFVLINHSAIPQIIYVGIWGATLSSALGNLLGGPRMLQSIAEDGALPAVLGKKYGKYDEPRIAVIFTFIMSAILLLYTNVDQILPILAMICLLSYGSINLIAGLNEIIDAPSWRPGIRMPWMLSIGGGLLCLMLMIMINAAWAIAAILLFIGIFTIMRFKSIDTDFNDLRESFFFFFSRHAIFKFSESDSNPITWHPQILAFISSPIQHENMLYLSHSLTRRTGILSISTILPENREEYHQMENTKLTMEHFFEKRNLSAFVDISANDDIYEGMKNLIKFYGAGPIQPNTIMFGVSAKNDNLNNVADLLETARDYKKNILLFYSPSETSPKIFKTKLKSRKKRIDIWWDNDYRDNFELMLSFANSLAGSPMWKHSNINLKAVTNISSAKENFKKYFRKYITSTRVKLSPYIYLDKSMTNPFSSISKYSNNAEIAFIGLPPNVNDSEGLEVFLNNFKDIKTPLIIVASYDDMDHREIYLQPQEY